MNAKHYVSLEVAKMLKEKGYNDEYQVCYYKKNGEIITPWCSDDDENLHYPRITLLEAMDWLEERGMILIFGLNTTHQAWWFNGYHKSENVYINDLKGVYDLYKDRNECMNAAIKKGLELL